MNDALRARLDAAAARLLDLERQLAAPETQRDREQRRVLGARYARLAPLAARYREYRDCERELAELTELDGDAALAELAGEERTRLAARLAELERALLERAAEEDDGGDGDAFLEIRAGTGGDEAALFAGDLFRMYERYAEKRGWELEPLTHHDGERGGYREIIARVRGEGAYARLRYESGTHRVQRVPRTESQGRIHTSAATVAVLPDAPGVDAAELRAEELRIDRFRASGAGGQHVNKTDSAVRVTHLPTGLAVECQDSRSQHRNREQALALLRARLGEEERRRRAAETAQTRRGLIGSGDRSERIRTYHFPQGRVTDHRIGLSLHALDRLLEGDLDPLIEPLRAARREAALARHADGG